MLGWAGWIMKSAIHRNGGIPGSDDFPKGRDKNTFIRPLRIIHTEWSQGWGGQEIRVLLEARLLLERGHEVIVACQPASPLALRAKACGVEVVEAGIKGAFDLAAIWRLYRVFKEKGIEIVNTHSSADSWAGMFASKMAGVPVLVRTRHLSVPVSGSFLNFIYDVPDAIITTAKRIKEMLVSNRRIPDERVFSIPTGVELQKFSLDKHFSDEERLKRELGINMESPVTSMIAVLRSWKGHSYFLDAAVKILKVRPDAKFLIVGEGPQRFNIAAKIKDLGIGSSVIMTGHRDDVCDILRITDVFVLPSFAYEGVPQSLLQAMAMETPVVASDAGGIGEAVRNMSTGLLTPPKDVDALAKAVIFVLNTPEKVHRMVINARKCVEKKYSTDVMMDRIIGVYTDLLRKKGRIGLSDRAVIN